MSIDFFLWLVILLELLFYGWFFYNYFFVDLPITVESQVAPNKTLETTNRLCEEMDVDCSGVKVNTIKKCVTCNAMVNLRTKNIYLTDAYDEVSIRHELGHLKEPFWFGDLMFLFWFIGFGFSLFWDRKNWKVYTILFLAFPFFGFEIVANYYSNLLLFWGDLVMCLVYAIMLYYNPVKDWGERIIFGERNV